MTKRLVVVMSIAVIVAIVIMIIVSNSGTTTHHATVTAKPPVTTSPRPTFLHRVGAYAVRPGDLALFHKLGFTLAMTDNIAATPPNGVVYLDTQALGQWRAIVRPLQCRGSGAVCPLSANTNAAITRVVSAKIDAAAADPHVAGLYVLDDFLGNVKALLIRIHTIAAAHGLETVCGFGGTLSFSRSGGPAPYSLDYASLAHYEQRELLNATPQACDAAVLYIYSLGNKINASDYSMTNLLPIMLADLRAHGITTWGISPQAWEGPPPDTGAQLAEQTTAACHAGASFVLAFTWHNFKPPVPELVDQADLRQGLVQGMKACQAIWGTK
jgi:hypothetical protein